MKNEKYYVGFDIGTDSVGYAVTDEQYNLCKFRGEPMWGVNIFEEAQLAVDRRNFRVARRRLDRRQQRIDMIRDIFAEEIYKVDKNFYKRLKESYLYPNTADEKVRLFDSYGEQRSYDIKYPTIHHLIFELMQSKDIHDVRHIYIACAWLVAHRGHFLSDVSKNNIEEVTDFGVLYKKLINYIKRDGRILPWNDNIDINLISSTLNKKTGITKKAKALTEVLFNGEKAPKVINDEYEFNYELLIKLLCGAKVGLKELFGREEYEDLDEKSIMLGMDDDKLSAIMQNIGEDADIISILKSIYDWAILIDVLKGKTSISEAKVEVYEQHKRDLKSLKYFIKKYLHEKYDEIFRSKTQNNNYVAYVGKNKTKSEDIKVKKSNSQEDLCKYLLSIFKNISPETNDFEEYQKITNRLEINDFLPKQVDGDNRVIPFQLYLYELNKILDNAQSYLPILSKVDENGLTGVQKIISVFEFRVPYYVGPLKENLENNKKINCWMKRKAEGKIYPWNFKDMVDLDASEELFIKRMTNSCTYLPGEDVLPKNSLIYCAFEVLNEINKIKINGVDISVEAKQGIYENVFMQFNKVTPKKIKHFLVANGYACEEDIISGLDITIKSSLIPFRLFRNLVEKELLSYSDVEAIIKRATYSEDKVRLCEWLHKEYPKLPDNEIKYILSMKFKDFGRLSRKLLCSVEGTNKQTGERFTILRAMWETNYNFMELCSNKFTFAEEIDNFVKVYYDINPKKITDIMDDMGVSNAVKRPIIRTLDIIKDVVKVKGNAPENMVLFR